MARAAIQRKVTEFQGQLHRDWQMISGKCSAMKPEQNSNEHLAAHVEARNTHSCPPKVKERQEKRIITLRLPVQDPDLVSLWSQAH